MPDFSPVSIASATNTGAATVNYPSDAGFDLGQYSDCCIEISAADCTINVQSSLSGTNWLTINPCVVDLETCTNLAGATVVGIGGDTFLWSLEDMPGTFLRLAVTYPNATNAFSASIGRKP